MRAMNENEIYSIPTPPRTKTWGVLAHGEVVEIMKCACRDSGMEPNEASKKYEVSKKGKRLFATWTFANNEGQTIAPTIGFRNSIDKSLSFGIVGGLRVIVCSNLDFAGEFTFFRKHTGNLSIKEAITYAKQSTFKIVRNIGHQIVRLKSYRYVDMDINSIKAYKYDLLANKIISVPELKTLDECFIKERKISIADGYLNDNLYILHSSVTRLLKEKSLPIIMDRTRILNNISTYYYDKIAA